MRRKWWRKTFPAFPAHAQPSILRIWQEADGVHIVAAGELATPVTNKLLGK